MMKCEIIRDLMPSYIDGITSEESRQEIRKHLEECSDCRKYEASMRQIAASPAYDGIYEEKTAAEIQPFKKVRKALTLRTILLIIFIITLIGSILYGKYENQWYGRDASVEDVQIEYKTFLLNNGMKIVDLCCQPTTDDIYLTVGYSEGPTNDSRDTLTQTNKNNNYIGVIKWKIKPSEKNNTIVSDTWEYCFLDKDTIFDSTEKKEIKLSGNEKLIIEFAKGVTKEIRIKDLYTGEGLDKVGIIMN